MLEVGTVAESATKMVPLDMLPKPQKSSLKLYLSNNPEGDRSLRATGTPNSKSSNRSRTLRVCRLIGNGLEP
jgi:hypothetical protein